jgi:hypothetical protein
VGEKELCCSSLLSILLLMVILMFYWNYDEELEPFEDSNISLSLPSTAYYWLILSSLVGCIAPYFSYSALLLEVCTPCCSLLSSSPSLKLDFFLLYSELGEINTDSCEGEGDYFSYLIVSIT